MKGKIFSLALFTVLTLILFYQSPLDTKANGLFDLKQDTNSKKIPNDNSIYLKVDTIVLLDSVKNVVNRVNTLKKQNANKLKRLKLQQKELKNN